MSTKQKHEPESIVYGAGRVRARRAESVARAPLDVRAEIEARTLGEADDLAACADRFRAMSYPALQRMTFSAFYAEFKRRRASRLMRP